MRKNTDQKKFEYGTFHAVNVVTLQLTMFHPLKRDSQQIKQLTEQSKNEKNTKAK